VFYNKNVIMAAVRAIQRMHSPDGGIQWLLVNSLTAKSVLAGTKNSRLEGFLLAKHLKHTAHKHHHHDGELFSPPAAWFCWTNIPHPREPLQKGLAEVAVEGI
jgi:hypothetical protein